MIVKLDLENAVPVNVVEHIYMRMAEASGIEISNTWLLRNQQGAHLIAQRFDRTPSGGKLHQHSFAGMAHLDFHQRGVRRRRHQQDSDNQCLVATAPHRLADVGLPRKLSMCNGARAGI